MLEIKKIVLGFVAAAMLMVPITAQASADNIYIADDANLLSDAEEADLRSYLETLSPATKYVVATSDNNDYGATEADKLDAYFTSVYSNYDDGVAFIIDMQNREIYISGYGRYWKDISNADALDITDNIYRYASKGDYYNCVYKAFEQADTLTNKGFILRPMRIIVSLLLAIILGFLISFFIAMTERAHAREDHSASTAATLLLAGSILGTAAVYDTKKVHRSSNSGSSGGHSGGFSGGGGGFSGGGGHSGGGHSF